MLRPEKRIFAVRLYRETPFEIEIVAKPNEGDALSLLWHAVVCCVEHARHDPLIEAFAFTLRVRAFEASKVIAPILVATRL